MGELLHDLLLAKFFWLPDDLFCANLAYVDEKIYNRTYSDHENDAISQLLCNPRRCAFSDLARSLQRGTLQDELTMRARSREHMPEGRLLEIFTGMCHGVQAIHGATPVALAHRCVARS